MPSQNVGLSHPRTPLASAAWVAVAILVFCALPADGARAAEGVDEVELTLQGGRKLRGQLFDLHSGSLEMRQPLGNVAVEKSSIERWVLRPSEGAGPAAPILLLKSGHQVTGKIEFSQAEGEWVVLMKHGAGRYPESQVERMIDPNGFCSDGTFTPRRGFEEMLEQLVQDALECPKVDLPARLERLSMVGFFAIPRLEKLVANPEQKRRTELARLLNHEKLRAALPPGVEKDFPDFNEKVSDTDPVVAIEALRRVLSERDTKIYPLLVQLLLDEERPPMLRTYCISTLQQRHRVGELLGAYQKCAGITQLAVAVALGDMGLYIGVPTLIEALEIDSEDARTLSIQKLEDYTGLTFGFDPKLPKGDNLTALSKWQDWYLDNRERFEETLSYSLVGATENPQRNRAAELWRQGQDAWDKAEVKRAETLFRGAIDTDPTCIPPYVCMGIIAYQDRGDFRAGSEWFQRAIRRSSEGGQEAMQRLAYYHLGRIFKISEDYPRAQEAFRKAVTIDPDYADAWYDLGEVFFAQAVDTRDLPAEERRGQFLRSRDTWQRGYEGLRSYRMDLVLLERGALPTGENMPFSRRQHNITISKLEKELRQLEARFTRRLCQVNLALSTAESNRKALEWIDKTIELEGEKQASVQQRARILDRLGRTEEAIAARARAAELEPREPAPE